MKNIQTGLRGYAETVVSKDNTALKIESGSLEVLATPMMTALMEKAACNAIAECLEDDETTVGTMLNITHDNATPVGVKVTASAEVIEVNGREITFSVKAADSCGTTGKGLHKRFVVYAEKFISKTQAKHSQPTY